ncbi:unnamed protein product [Schistosoma margrebowiei]|uniref:Dynein light chain n=1 Tax=Schistosoma margrebowiei TaxID=48269 RepID=A0A183MH86_9TREM|nr:unnamed protein product [Schistosoma margrebowiei]
MVKDADMNRAMQEDAVYIAANAIDEHNTEQEIARYIKIQFDHKHKPYWHCIVGGTFSSYVTMRLQLLRNHERKKCAKQKKLKKRKTTCTFNNDFISHQYEHEENNNNNKKT